MLIKINKRIINNRKKCRRAVSKFKTKKDNGQVGELGSKSRSRLKKTKTKINPGSVPN